MSEDTPQLGKIKCPKTTSHLLQQNFDEPLLLCTVARELMSLLCESVELAIGLKSLHLEVRIATVVYKIEEVDEDWFQDLSSISKAPRSAWPKLNHEEKSSCTF